MKAPVHGREGGKRVERWSRERQSSALGPDGDRITANRVSLTVAVAATKTDCRDSSGTGEVATRGQRSRVAGHVTGFSVPAPYTPGALRRTEYREPGRSRRYRQAGRSVSATGSRPSQRRLFSAPRDADEVHHGEPAAGHRSTHTGGSGQAGHASIAAANEHVTARYGAQGTSLIHKHTGRITPDSLRVCRSCFCFTEYCPLWRVE